MGFRLELIIPLNHLGLQESEEQREFVIVEVEKIRWETQNDLADINEIIRDIVDGTADSKVDILKLDNAILVAERLVGEKAFDRRVIEMQMRDISTENLRINEAIQAALATQLLPLRAQEEIMRGNLQKMKEFRHEITKTIVEAADLPEVTGRTMEEKLDALKLTEAHRNVMTGLVAEAFMSKKSDIQKEKIRLEETIAMLFDFKSGDFFEPMKKSIQKAIDIYQEELDGLINIADEFNMTLTALDFADPTESVLGLENAVGLLFNKLDLVEKKTGEVNLNFETMASLVPHGFADAFHAMGVAMADAGDVGLSFAASIQATIAEALRLLSVELAIAGAKQLAAMNIPLGLSLLAASGIVGIGAGIASATGNTTSSKSASAGLGSSNLRTASSQPTNTVIINNTRVSGSYIASRNAGMKIRR